LSGSILLFSHGQFGRSLAARWIGLPIIEAQHLEMDPASISVLAFSPAHPEVAVIAQWNSTLSLTAQQANRTMIDV
jgi:broad specificity phosphatase PhoE